MVSSLRHAPTKLREHRRVLDAGVTIPHRPPEELLSRASRLRHDCVVDVEVPPVGADHLTAFQESVEDVPSDLVPIEPRRGHGPRGKLHYHRPRRHRPALSLARRADRARSPPGTAAAVLGAEALAARRSGPKSRQGRLRLSRARPRPPLARWPYSAPRGRLLPPLPPPRPARPPLLRGDRHPCARLQMRLKWRRRLLERDSPRVADRADRRRSRRSRRAHGLRLVDRHRVWRRWRFGLLRAGRRRHGGGRARGHGSERGRGGPQDGRQGRRRGGRRGADLAQPAARRWPSERRAGAVRVRGSRHEHRPLAGSQSRGADGEGARGAPRTPRAQRGDSGWGAASQPVHAGRVPLPASGPAGPASSYLSLGVLGVLGAILGPHRGARERVREPSLSGPLPSDTSHARPRPYSGSRRRRRRRRRGSRSAARPSDRRRRGRRGTSARCGT